MKDEHSYFKMSDGDYPRSIFSSSNEEHSRIRRSISSIFTTKSLDELEPCLLAVSDKLVSQLRKVISEGPQDMVNWFKLATGDLSGQFTVGLDLKSLETKEHHLWVQSQQDIVQIAAKVTQLNRFGFHYFLRVCTFFGSKIVTGYEKQWYEDAASYAQAARDRVARGEKEIPNALQSMLAHTQEGSKRISEEEVIANLAAIFAAGSDTTYGSLSSIMFWLCMFPEAQSKLRHELQETFRNSADIGSRSTHNLRYLNAVIEEGLRMFGPTPDIPARVVPHGGAVILGEKLPAGVRFSIIPLSESVKLIVP
jgi:cytochrome P450